MSQFLSLIILFSQQSILQNENSEPTDIPVEPIPLVSSELFKEVNTQVAGISPAESQNYYDILNQVQYFSEKLLLENHRQFVDYRKTFVNSQSKTKKQYSVFVDMFKNPKLFQGMSIQLKGHARKIIKYPAGENDFGIKHLYECWLYTEDSQSNPAVIISTQIPEGLPLGEEITDSVEALSVTGIFYKNYIYSAQDTIRRAPMILAREIHWNPVKPVIKKSYSNQTILIISFSFLVVFLILYLLGNTRTKRNLIAKEEFIDDPL
jgi:hypothetical protein